MQLPMTFLDTTHAGHPGIKEVKMLDVSISFLDSADVPGSTGAPLRVLFIGNSLTFGNAMPRMFAQLAAAALHRKVIVGLAAIPGGAAWMLWQMTDVQQVIRRLPWDDVVLQMRPMALHDAMNLNRDAKQYAEAITAQHAKMVIWGQGRGPRATLAVQAALDSGFAGAAAVVGATLASIPAAMEAVHEADTTLWHRLFYSETNPHPSVLGSYLQSLVIYQAITGQSPVGLPHTAGTVAVPDRDAELLQRAALSATKNP
jgi:hypothetical protein